MAYVDTKRITESLRLSSNILRNSVLLCVAQDVKPLQRRPPPMLGKGKGKLGTSKLINLALTYVLTL